MSSADRLPRLLAVGVLARAFPLDLVDEVIDLAGAREQRERTLPARLTVYFTMALWLFVSSGYEYVMARLVEGLAWVRQGLSDREMPHASSLARARDRLGPEALQLLFERVAGPVGTPGTGGAFWRGRRLVSWDGTTLEVPDTPANAHAWGRPTERVSPQLPPRIRLFALAECGTQAVIGATFGPYGMTETQLARRLLRHLGPGMVVLADLHSVDRELWTYATDTGADLVWRIPGDRLSVRQTLADGTYLTTFGPRRSPGFSPAAVRVINFTVTGEDARPEPFSLATTLTDPRTAPRAEIVRLYRDRWDLSHAIYTFSAEGQQPSRVTLRSTKPEGVVQEVWAFFCVQHAVRDFLTTYVRSGQSPYARISFDTP